MVDVFAWKRGVTEVADSDVRQAYMELNEDAERLDKMHPDNGFAFDKLGASIQRRAWHLSDVIPDEQRKAAMIFVDQVVYGL